jgi:SAM-dependent methyltransferase
MNWIEIIDSGSALTPQRVEAWYHNIEAEIGNGVLSPEDAAYFAAYYREAGMLRTWRRPFFMRHYAEPFAAAANFLMDGRSDRKKLIVDLGCGSGTQTIALALMGAKVVGLDMDTQGLGILLKRKKFYEDLTGRTLDIEVHDSDVFAFDFDALGPIDGVYSMFAFNMMQPTKGLLDILLPRMARGARFVIQDGNQHSWLSRIPGRRRSVLSPHELDQELAKGGLSRCALEGTISLPPLVWLLLPKQPLRALDGLLNKTWFWPISYMAMHEKAGLAQRRTSDTARGDPRPGASLPR